MRDENENEDENEDEDENENENKDENEDENEDEDEDFSNTKLIIQNLRKHNGRTDKRTERENNRGTEPVGPVTG